MSTKRVAKKTTKPKTPKMPKDPKAKEGPWGRGTDFPQPYRGKKFYSPPSNYFHLGAPGNPVAGPKKDRNSLRSKDRRKQK